MDASVLRLGLIFAASVDPSVDDFKRAVDHRFGVAWFYLRLAAVPRRGLTLLLVIRGGLWLGECLDVTVVGRNVLAETLPRTIRPGSMSVLEVVTHSRRSPLNRTLCRLLHRQLLRIELFSLLPQVQGHCRDLPRQRHFRQLVASDAS